MKKIVLAVIGTMAIVVGGINWLVGALVPHSRYLIAAGVIALVIAGIQHLRQRQLRQEPTLPLLLALIFTIFGAADIRSATAIEQALTPPEKIPMLQWSPHAATGMDTWAIVFISMAVGLVYWFFVKSLGRRSCQPWKKL